MKKSTVRVTRGYNCGCPQYCKYCGAKRELSRDGHYCPVGSCKQHAGYEGCRLRSTPVADTPVVGSSQDVRTPSRGCMLTALPEEHQAELDDLKSKRPSETS